MTATLCFDIGFALLKGVILNNEGLRIKSLNLSNLYKNLAYTINGKFLAILNINLFLIIHHIYLIPTFSGMAKTNYHTKKEKFEILKKKNAEALLGGGEKRIE